MVRNSTEENKTSAEMEVVVFPEENIEYIADYPVEKDLRFE